MADSDKGKKDSNVLEVRVRTVRGKKVVTRVMKFKPTPRTETPKTPCDADIRAEVVFEAKTRRDMGLATPRGGVRHH